jgi:hypothetical protein
MLKCGKAQGCSKWSVPTHSGELGGQSFYAKKEFENDNGPVATAELEEHPKSTG